MYAIDKRYYLEKSVRKLAVYNGRLSIHLSCLGSGFGGERGRGVRGIMVSGRN